MRFAVPQFLWLLLVGPALIAFFWWAGRARQRLMTQFIQARLLSGLLSDYSPIRKRIRAGLLVGAVMLAAVALARPQWGFHLEEVKQRGLDIVVAMDTSRSMLAADVAPNRLQRAKLEAIALQQLCRADRLGLVAFAGTAFLQCPLSLDDDAFRQGLEALDVSIIPQGGTALAEAIRTTLGAFKQKTDNHKVLVLFSDGEDHDGQAVEAARDAAKEGLRIFTVGVGTPNGELLAAVDDQGRRSFIKDSDGNVVKSRLNEGLLQEVATVANGFYLPLSGAKTMDTLYQRGLAPLPRTDSESKTIRQYYERFPWFLAPAIMLLLVEMFIGDAKPGAKPRILAPKPATLAAALLLAMLAAGPRSEAAGSSKMNVQSSSDEAAREELKREREARLRQRALEKEIQNYDRRLKKHPEDSRLHYNKGTFHYELKDYSAAEKELKQALSTPDLKLQERAYYNLGNTYYRQGEELAEPQKKMAGWQEAVSSYESAVKLDPNDEDARYNLEVVKKKLEELKQQQQQNQDKDNDQKQDKDKQDQKQQGQQKDQQKDQQQGDQQKKEDQQNQKQDSQQQEQEQKQQEQSQQQQQKQDAEKQQQPTQDRPGEQKDGDQNQDAAKAMKMMQMTPEQAKQLLDAQRAEEKPMPFWRLLRTNRVERVHKDW